uniref:Uncharacterized protein n=1 Tax=Tanacetum cinerariifolium TaxID=118510 RepID=A0A699JF86_TANCI|nr:hypothetical protein [Tanacetum cinerariifolium]
MPSVFKVGESSGFVPESERPERVSTLRQPTLTTWIDPEDGIAYIDVRAYPPPAPPTQTPPSPEWSLELEQKRLAVTFRAIWRLVFSLESWAEERRMRLDLVKIVDSMRRGKEPRGDVSLEHEQKRLAVTFGAIWRLVLALESWAGQTDAQRAALWHAISDTQRENWELRLHLAEERRVRLDLVKIVDSMRRGQEPRGDV